jgi:superfamily I DNA/RNA helicase
MKSTNEQTDIIESIRNFNIIKVNAYSGTGKEQPISEPILTPDGWCTMGDIKKGDYVIGSNGQPIKVLDTFDQGIKDVFKFEFCDSTFTYCGLEHLWTVTEFETLKTITLTTKELIDSNILDEYSNPKYLIRLPDAVNFSEVDLSDSLSPYQLGLTLSGTDEDLLKKYINHIGDEVIPYDYLFNNIKKRQQLFDGIMQNSTKSFNDNILGFVTMNSIFKDHVIELSRSLGHYVTCDTHVLDQTLYSEKKLYKISISKKRKYKAITRIQHDRQEHSKCIKVDAEDNLYVTRGYTLTHNTTTLYQLTCAYPDLRFLYLVFSKELKKEAESKFNTDNTEARTTHSFALSHVRNDLNVFNRKHKISGGINVWELQKILKVKNYTHAMLSRNVFTAFCQSEYININKETVDELLDQDKELKIDVRSSGLKSEQLANNLIAIWQLMYEDKMSITHDFYLKFFQINIEYYSDKINYDVILLDECQDSNNVTLSIFDKFRGKKVMVGDKYQSIFGWRKAINVMDKIDSDISLNLTHTFRFGTNIAKYANNILLQIFGEKKEIIPFYPNVNKEIKTQCTITRTNAGLIREFDKLHNNGILVKTIRDPKDIFSMSMSLLYFGKDKFKYKDKITEKQLFRFKSILEIETFAKEVNDVELIIALKLVDEYGDRLEDLFDIAKSNYRKRKNIDMYLTTAHSAKGKEWDKVIVADDFNDLLELLVSGRIYSIKDMRYIIKTNYPKIQPISEEFNLFYVAITRAMVELDCQSTNLKYLSMTKDEIDLKIQEIKEIFDKKPAKFY